MLFLVTNKLILTNICNNTTTTNHRVIDKKRKKIHKKVMNENERAKSTCKEKIIIFIPVKHHHHQVVINRNCSIISINRCVCVNRTITELSIFLHIGCEIYSKIAPPFSSKLSIDRFSIFVLEKNQNKLEKQILFCKKNLKLIDSGFRVSCGYY